MEPDRKARPFSLWVSLGFYACAVVFLALAYAWLIPLLLQRQDPHSLPSGTESAPAAFPLYFAIIAFLIATIIKPDRWRAGVFVGAFVLFLIMWGFQAT